MKLRPEADPRTQHSGDLNNLLVLVPGMGIREADFHSNGLIAAVEQRGCRVSVAIVDPGADAYLDGSLEARLLQGIGEARRASGASRVWLAGISLGCQGILRCVRARPTVTVGLMLITPYLASTGLIAEIGRAGGLRGWAAASLGRVEPDRAPPDRALMQWLATAPLPKMLVGRALDDRFATTATMLADRLPAECLVSVAGKHDWASWCALWGLLLDQDPFGQKPCATAR